MVFFRASSNLSNHYPLYIDLDLTALAAGVYQLMVISNDQPHARPLIIIAD